MIRDASRHRWRLRATCHAQTLMQCAEVIDRPDQLHAMLQRPRAACQRASSACQRCQPITQCRVQPLDGRRVDLMCQHFSGHSISLAFSTCL